MAELSTKLANLELKNPVMTASGTFGFGYEYADYVPLDRLGAVVVKGIATFPWEGNPAPRTAEVTAGMLNAIGLQGPGVESFLHEEPYLPFLKRAGATVIVNIWGRTLDEYAEVAAQIDAESEGIAAIELNISCPNIKEGGVAFGTDPKLTGEAVSIVRAATQLPLITKLSPNVSNIAKFAEIAVDSGSDIISLINTLPGMAIDIETRIPKIANRTGGLSGPAIKPIAVRMVYDVAQAVDVPIIGMGGICSAEDAVEFFLAGADAIAVGTAIFSDPGTPIRVIEGLEQWLDRHGCKSVSEIIGAVKI